VLTETGRKALKLSAVASSSALAGEHPRVGPRPADDLGTRAQAGRVGFITYTDSETSAGNLHPAQALRQYRSEFVGDAKAVVVGVTSNGFTRADPNDRGMLDVVGFDTSVPAVITDFVRS